MKAISTLVVLAFLAMASARQTQQEENLPPHCTEIEFIKENYNKNNTERHDTSSEYIEDKQQQAFLNLLCRFPSEEVVYAKARACDWTTAPLMAFSIDVEYLEVIRQDPAGKYARKAVVSMYHGCLRH